MPSHHPSLQRRGMPSPPHPYAADGRARSKAMARRIFGEGSSGGRSAGSTSSRRAGPARRMGRRVDRFGPARNALAATLPARCPSAETPPGQGRAGRGNLSPRACDYWRYYRYTDGNHDVRRTRWPTPLKR
eukprot:scaffold2799_cov408-Prasinococcus_capsulatus_cf.AAC.35